jgi:hypothetical protein
LPIEVRAKASDRLASQGLQRLEDPKHWPSLRQLENAASALGKRLVLSFE